MTLRLEEAIASCDQQSVRIRTVTAANYHAMSLDELRRYVLTHRQDDNAFHIYIERSKAAGRMIARKFK